MENKFWKFIGFWAMGLILFVATMIIIRWVIDFVTWSTLDSGWAQVIGSIAALAVAIYVMSRQNAHAARLIVDADLLALRRRAAAISAIFKRTVSISFKAHNIAATAREHIQDINAHCLRLNNVANDIDVMITKIEAIPSHELGSFELVDSLTRLHGNLTIFREDLRRMVSTPDLIGRPGRMANLESFKKNITDAQDDFHAAMRELK